MNKIWKLALSYLKYYKKQTVALFVGIVLSTTLMVGIGCLMYSGTKANQIRTKEVYGDWQYQISDSDSWFDEFKNYTTGENYQVEQYGTLLVKKKLKDPDFLTFCYGDAAYLEMMKCPIVKGKYPTKPGEVAVDETTIANLNLTDQIGVKVVIAGEEYQLCGIVARRWDPNLGDLKIFVSRDMRFDQKSQDRRLLYLKFREDGNVLKQFMAFAKQYDIDYRKKVTGNDQVLPFLGGYVSTPISQIVQTGLQLKEGQITYILANLNEEYQFMEKLILAVLGIFGAFISYSIFQVSVLKRLSQYSVMQVVGLQESHIFQILLTELMLIFTSGYVTGCLMGIAVGSFMYARIGKIFVDQTIGVPHTSSFVQQHIESDSSVVGQLQIKTGHFCISKNVICGCAVFMLFLMIWITFCLVHKMKKYTLQQMIHQTSVVKHAKRKIYSLHRNNLTGILTKKFMFGKIGDFITLVIALSLGGCIFIGTTYVTQNTKHHNELTFKADDGLGSDLQVYEDSDDLRDGIKPEQAEKMKQIDGIQQISPVSYTLGEVPLKKGMLKWKAYFAETAHEEGYKPDPVVMEKYNGEITEENDGSNRLKVNVYGYCEDMLESLQDYCLVGSIEPENMQKNHQVILKTIMDGQGNYDGIDLKVGDSITVKVPKSGESSKDLLRFQAPSDQYVEQEVTIGAIVSRPLAKNDRFIGDDGVSNVDLILTNEQMKEYFGVQNYNTLSIQLEKKADGGKAAQELGKITSGITHCMVRDYTQLIKQQNGYLKQKIYFFYGVAFVILVISILHIMNSMQYLILSRRREFGILRAMGITDSGFRKMLIKEGVRYGIYSNLVMLLLYLMVQKFLYYLMVHVYRYLHPDGSLPVAIIGLMCGVNLVICIGSVILSGKTILKETIIEEIQ